MSASFHFAAPWWFLLAPLILSPLWSDGRRPAIAWPGTEGFTRLPRGMSRWLRGLPLLGRMLACAALLAALARPQSVAGSLRIRGRGVAIVLAVDTSRTMGLADFPSPDGKRSRLGAAKRTAARFVSGRPNDLIGLVAFANFPDTTCPPTLDHEFLRQTIASLTPAPSHEAGTNLGDALAWALRDVREASPQRKVVVLITDGQNEPGVAHPLDPVAAARLCRDLGVRLHVICLDPPADNGERGPLPDVLATMAIEAGGTVQEAGDEQALDKLFAAIDGLERSSVAESVRTRYREWYPPLLIGAICCLIMAQLLRLGRWSRLP